MYKAPDISSKSNLQPPENSTEKEEDGSRGRKESTHTHKKKTDGYVQPSPAMVSSPSAAREHHDLAFTNRKYAEKQSESRVERERERDMRKLDCILINESEDT